MTRRTRKGKNPADYVRANGDGTATVELTQGKVSVIDVADAEIVSCFFWFAKRIGKCWYAGRTEDGKDILLHRVLAGSRPDQLTDHRDGDGLNNRRSNIRVCTSSQNLGNWIKRSRKSQFKGVSPSKFGRTFQTSVGSGKLRWTAYFPTAEDAARAYDERARIHYGAFAVLNFPRPGERSALTGEILPLPNPSAA